MNEEEMIVDSVKVMKRKALDNGRAEVIWVMLDDLKCHYSDCLLEWIRENVDARPDGESVDGGAFVLEWE